ncbi:MAG: ribonuclease HII [Dehalococcoidia bacterium]
MGTLPIGDGIARKRQLPTLAEEIKLGERGYDLIAGIDEVGRGPLAGPLLAAAIILPANTSQPWMEMVQDSKRLLPKKREFLFYHLQETALAIGIGSVPPQYIDVYGVVMATRMAMSMAVRNLRTPPQFLLIDAFTIPGVKLPQRGIVHGDATCLSIASASIIAKVTRDRIMGEWHQVYPGYGFAQHKGYATPEHLDNLSRLGPSQIHRKSFAPVREFLEGNHIRRLSRTEG